MNSGQTRRQLIEECFEAALSAVNPAQAVACALSQINTLPAAGGPAFPISGKVTIVAIGKAAEQMTAGAVEVLDDRIDQGFVITKEGHASRRLDSRFQLWQAGHPIPNDIGVEAATTTMAALSRVSADDVVVALISGGGSALFEAPKPPVVLTDIAAVTALLLNAGAPIQDLNAVRIPLSAVKGGQLRNATPARRFVTLIVSDVLSNDPAVIASGPTVQGDASAALALATLQRYNLLERVPESVLTVLRRDDRTRVGQFEDIVHVIADNTTALNAAASHARNGGFPVEVRWRKREGEASDLGRQWVEPLERRSGPVVVLGGGEATVTVREDGLGGRNTEFALSAAVDLDRRRLHGWSIASLATDGQDAQTGSAGAIVTSETIRAAKQQLLDPAVALQRNDSASLLAQTGDLLVTGPTGTNVNDLYFAVNLGDIC